MRTYRTLALVGTFIKIIGWLTVIGTLLSACALLVLGTAGGLALPGLTDIRIPIGGLAAGAVGQVIATALYVLAGLVAGALQIASAELIELFIDMSVGAQRSVQLLERLARAPLQPQAPPTPPPAPAPTPMPVPGAYPPQGYQGQ
jgi:hypothetical protein